MAIFGLLLWFVVGAKGLWWLKVPVITVTLLFSILIWGIVGNLMGWATSDELPSKYRVHWIVVEEPGFKHNRSGAIYVLGKDLAPKEDRRIILGRQINFHSPRLYQIPYSRQAHEQAQKIKGKLRKGMTVTMGRGQGKGEGGAGGKGGEGKGGKSKFPGQGKGSKGDGSGSFSGKSPTPLGYELPPASYPDKGPQE
jgi:hypothetical protein